MMISNIEIYKWRIIKVDKEYRADKYIDKRTGKPWVRIKYKNKGTEVIIPETEYKRRYENSD